MWLKNAWVKEGTLIKITHLQDGIQHIEAAYGVFIKGGARDLQHYIFELQTRAAISLDPARIREYLSIIHKKDNLQTCQNVTEYIFLILGQFLQIMERICFKIMIYMITERCQAHKM